MDDLVIRKVIFGSSEYDALINLRAEILRKPLGLKFSEEALMEEEYHHHFGAYNPQGHVIGNITLVFLSNEIVKMRQVAVAEKYQGFGVGRQMVIASELFAAELGAKEMVLNARKNAIPFYQKLNYTIQGEEFLEIGIPHSKMTKFL